MLERSKKGTKAKGGQEPQTLRPHRVALSSSAGACHVARGLETALHGLRVTLGPCFSKVMQNVPLPSPVFKLFKQLHRHDWQKSEEEST